MVDFTSTLQAATKNAVCSVLSGPQAAAYVVGRLPLVGDAASDIGDRVRRARRALCDNTDNSVDTPEAPFTGGQCPGVQYSVSAEIVTVSPYTDEEYRRTASVSAIGPIAEVNGQVLSSRSNCTPTGGGDGFRDVTNLRNRLIVQDANGNFYTSPLTSPESFPWGPDDCTAGDPILPNDVEVLENIVIVRSDGLPDDCGDIDVPPIPPYQPTTITQNITYNDNSSTEVTEEGDFTVNIPFFIGGNIIAPVTVNLGDLAIPVELNLSTGDITFDFGGGDSPVPIDDPGEAEENPTNDEPEVEKPTLFYGLIVYSTRLGGIPDITTSVAQDQAPTLRLPRTGNVYFQIPVGDRVTWVGPSPVQLENEYIPVPHGLGASGFRLVPNTGWQLLAVEAGKPGCGCVSD